MATNTVTSNTNKTHYARLGQATQNLIPKFLQELLLFYENPRDIFNTCHKNKVLKKRLKQKEISKLRDAAANGTYSGFDISLIYAILRNLHKQVFCPSSGWDHPNEPLPNQISIGDDVERCRRTRNMIVHRGNTSVSDLELDNFFDIFRGIALRFEKALQKTPNEFVSQVDELKTCGMDEATEKRNLQEIKELKQDRAKQMEVLRSLRQKQIENQTEISNLRGQLMNADDEDENWHDGYDSWEDEHYSSDDEYDSNEDGYNPWADEDEIREDEYDSREDEYDSRDDDYEQRDEDYDQRDDDYDQGDEDYDQRDDDYDQRDDDYEQRDEDYDQRNDDYDQRDDDYDQSDNGYDYDYD